MAGSALLFLTFLLQLAANLVPKDLSPSFLKSSVCMWLLYGSLVLVLLLAALLSRRLIAKSCSRQIREIWDQKIASQQK